MAIFIYTCVVLLLALVKKKCT